jgi:hypothetical protein
MTISTNILFLTNKITYINNVLHTLLITLESDLLLDSNCLNKSEMTLKYNLKLQFFSSQLVSAINDQRS